MLKISYFDILALVSETKAKMSKVKVTVKKYAPLTCSNFINRP